MDAGPPPGQLIDIGGYRLHLQCEGEGHPTAVFEAAMWDAGLTWSLVQPEPSNLTRACVYDRAGLGWSDPSPRPRTADVMVEELRAPLTVAEVASPYALVPIRLGGYWPD
jgi:hypothetical protein